MKLYGIAYRDNFRTTWHLSTTLHDHYEDALKEAEELLRQKANLLVNAVVVEFNTPEEK